MKNDRLDALHRRDTATVAGLDADKKNYEPLEDDIEPLRTQLGLNHAKADALIDDVLQADADDSAEVKTKSKKLLLPLLARLSAVLKAFANSKANTDEDLLPRVTLGSDVLYKADEDTFLRLATALLKEADHVPAVQLTKREFSAEDLAETKRLTKRFGDRLTPGRLADVDGKSARELLSDLLAANQQLIKKNPRAAAALQKLPHQTRRLAALPGLRQCAAAQGRRRPGWRGKARRLSLH